MSFLSSPPTIGSIGSSNTGIKSRIVIVSDVTQRIPRSGVTAVVKISYFSDVPLWGHTQLSARFRGRVIQHARDRRASASRRMTMVVHRPEVTGPFDTHTYPLPRDVGIKQKTCVEMRRLCASVPGVRYNSYLFVPLAHPVCYSSCDPWNSVATRCLGRGNVEHRSTLGHVGSNESTFLDIRP